MKNKIYDWIQSLGVGHPDTVILSYKSFILSIWSPKSHTVITPVLSPSNASSLWGDVVYSSNYCIYLKFHYNSSSFVQWLFQSASYRTLAFHGKRL